MVRDVKTGVAGGEKDFWSRAPRRDQRCPAPWFPTSEGRNSLSLCCGAQFAVVCCGSDGKLRRACRGAAAAPQSPRTPVETAGPLRMLTGPALVPGFP